MSFGHRFRWLLGARARRSAATGAHVGSGQGSDRCTGGRVFGSYTRSTPGVQRRGAISPDAGRVATASEGGPATFGSGAGSTRPRAKAPAVEQRRPDAAAAAAVFAAGDAVSHKTFGPGTVISVDGDSSRSSSQRSGKTKKLMKGFAPIVSCRRATPADRMDRGAASSFSARRPLGPSRRPARWKRAALP